MGRLRKKFTGNTAEASSEAVPSQNSTPKSLKPKPKISRNALNKGTPQIQEKKKKKKSVLGSSNPSISNEKGDDKSQNPIQRCTTDGEHDIKSQEIIKIEGKGAGLEKNQSQMNEENQDQLESQQDEKNKEKLDSLQKKQQFAKNKEKWFKKIEDGEKIEEKHGQLESHENEKKKQKVDDLQKKQRFDKKKEKLDGLPKKEQFNKNKEKWFKKTEDGQKNEEKHSQLESQQIEKKKEKVGGLIFMCSAKTKPDCFRYSLMGLPMSKKDQVLGIKPGLKLFLYDFDLKLLYGIYVASSNGGMRLEPAAFGGAFPVQVRFSVYQDCYPLPDTVFKTAIKENYNDKNRFDTELTDSQVEKLTKLFRPAEVHSHAPPMGPTLMPPIQDTNVNLQTYDEGRRYGQHIYGEVPSAERKDFPQNGFPTESEYRTYGLRGERQNLTPPSRQIAPPLEPHLGHVRQHILIHPGYLHMDAAPAQVQIATRHDPHIVSEDHTSGLFPRQELQYSTPLAATTSASYAHPRVGSYLDPHWPPSGRGEVPLLRSSSSGRGESYLTENTHLGRTENVDAAMLYSTYASNALAEYNQTSKHQVVGPESSLAPVSSRYSFAGPSLAHR